MNGQPKSEKSAQARENIKVLTAAEVKNTMEIAKFYDKTKNYKAAAVYYNEVIRSAPGGWTWWSAPRHWSWASTSVHWTWRS